jgi:hypothetical protein
VRVLSHEAPRLKRECVQARPEPCGAARERLETGRPRRAFLDLERLIEASRWLENRLGRELEGQVYKAGTFAPVARQRGMDGYP